MCSARRLMVFNVCVEFNENMSSGFKIMERTRKFNTQRAITPKVRLVGCFGLSGPLRQYFSLHRTVSQREGERGKKRKKRVKMSKQPLPVVEDILVELRDPDSGN